MRKSTVLEEWNRGAAEEKGRKERQEWSAGAGEVRPNRCPMLCSISTSGHVASQTPPPPLPSRRSRPSPCSIADVV